LRVLSFLVGWANFLWLLVFSAAIGLRPSYQVPTRGSPFRDRILLYRCCLLFFPIIWRVYITAGALALSGVVACSSEFVLYFWGIGEFILSSVAFFFLSSCYLFLTVVLRCASAERGFGEFFFPFLSVFSYLDFMSMSMSFVLWYPASPLQSCYHCLFFPLPSFRERLPNQAQDHLIYAEL